MMTMENLIICPRCNTLQKREKLKKGEVAYCSECGMFLYKKIASLPQKLLAYSLTAFIFFVMANIYPIVSIDIKGMEGSFTLLGAIESLVQEGYIFVAIFSFLTLFLFPFVQMLLLFLFILLLKKRVAKYLLVLLSRTQKWSMVDIFFVAILVALVKIEQYADIEFGIAFWSMAIFVGFEIYLFRIVKIEYLWELLGED